MNSEIRNLLTILGFDKSLSSVPTLSEIRRQFRKECLVKHPDKTSGSKDTFQQLLAAYQKLVLCLDHSEQINTELELNGYVFLYD